MKRLKKIINFITLILIISIGNEKFFYNKIYNYLENKKIENYFNQESVSKNKNIDYEKIIEIPKINLKKGIYNKNSKYNNINYNIEILKESMSNNTYNLVLAAHSGNSKISYFKNLDKLNIGDNIYIYYNQTKYTYKINNYQEIKKGSSLYVDKTKSQLLLITCKKNSKDIQLVFEAKQE